MIQMFVMCVFSHFVSLRTMHRGLSRASNFVCDCHLFKCHMIKWPYGEKQMFSYDGKRWKNRCQSWFHVFKTNRRNIIWKKHAKICFKKQIYENLWKLGLVTITDVNPTDLNPCLLLVSYIRKFNWFWDRKTKVLSIKGFDLVLGVSFELPFLAIF